MDSQIRVNPLLKGMMSYQKVENEKQVSAKTFTKFLVAKSELEVAEIQEESSDSFEDVSTAQQIPISEELDWDKQIQETVQREQAENLI